MYRDRLQLQSNVVTLVFLRIVKRPKMLTLNCFVLLNTSLKTLTCQPLCSLGAAKGQCFILKEKSLLNGFKNRFYHRCLQKTYFDKRHKTFLGVKDHFQYVAHDTAVKSTCSQHKHQTKQHIFTRSGTRYTVYFSITFRLLTDM